MFATTTTVGPTYVALLGIVVYVAATLATVPLAGVTLLVSTLTDYTTREVTTGLGGLFAAVGVGGFAYHVLVLPTSLGTALGVAVILLAGTGLLWVLPLAVGTGMVSLSDTDTPLRYAVAGWPVAAFAPVAFLRAFTPSSSLLLSVALFAVPILGTGVVGYVVARIHASVGR